MKPLCAAPSVHRISSRHCFFAASLLQKRQRPSRGDGGCCEKGMPSSGEKIVRLLAENFGVLTVDLLEVPASRRHAHGRHERRLP